MLHKTKIGLSCAIFEPNEWNLFGPNFHSIILGTNQAIYKRNKPKLHKIGLSCSIFDQINEWISFAGIIVNTGDFPVSLPQ